MWNKLSNKMFEINWNYLNDDGDGTEYDTNIWNYSDRNHFPTGIIDKQMTDGRLLDVIANVATIVHFGVIQHFSLWMERKHKLATFPY